MGEPQKELPWAGQRRDCDPDLIIPTENRRLVDFQSGDDHSSNRWGCGCRLGRLWHYLQLGATGGNITGVSAPRGLVVPAWRQALGKVFLKHAQVDGAFVP
jgi:hypothetical protein